MGVCGLCSLDLDSQEDGIIWLGCGHGFHFSCIDETLKIRPVSCPSCSYIDPKANDKAVEVTEGGRLIRGKGMLLDLRKLGTNRWEGFKKSVETICQKRGHPKEFEAIYK